jgi:isocitrate dehydrogenase (NAD+)
LIQEQIAMRTITLIPGDGIGPEVAFATKKLIDASGAKLNWDIQNAGSNMIDQYGTPLPKPVIDSIIRNGIALKGPITTPVGEGFRSVNVALRKELDLYVNLRPIKTYQGIPSRYEGIDLVIVRENTEDLYAGIEHMVGEDAAESIKVFTRKGCERICRYAFEYARREQRRKVTAVHKANIMKCTDGMFLSIARDISKEYPDIEFEEMIIDAMCMRLVQSPESYDVLVLPNLYGDIVSDLCAGLVGGLGFAPGANIGSKYAVFEPVHGSAPDIAGKNIANPIAMMLSGVYMLRHIGEIDAANRIESVISFAIKEGKAKTHDLGGSFGTEEFTDYLISNM